MRQMGIGECGKKKICGLFNKYVEKAVKNFDLLLKNQFNYSIIISKRPEVVQGNFT